MLARLLHCVEQKYGGRSAAIRKAHARGIAPGQAREVLRARRVPQARTMQRWSDRLHLDWRYIEGAQASASPLHRLCDEFARTSASRQHLVFFQIVQKAFIEILRTVPSARLSHLAKDGPATVTVDLPVGDAPPASFIFTFTAKNNHIRVVLGLKLARMEIKPFAESDCDELALRRISCGTVRRHLTSYGAATPYHRSRKEYAEAISSL